jgi:hypothetical protein
MKIRVLELPSNNTVLAINIPTPSMQRKIWWSFNLLAINNLVKIVTLSGWLTHKTHEHSLWRKQLEFYINQSNALKTLIEQCIKVKFHSQCSYLIPPLINSLQKSNNVCYYTNLLQKLNDGCNSIERKMQNCN